MSGTRFKFGANWESFSRTALNPDRIEQARADLGELYRGVEFEKKRFLDIGFGQGLTLCIAAERGAFVHGLDIDPQSNEALERTRRFFENIEPPETTIGSVLDREVVNNLLERGQFDIVHAWGSLHHTGSLWDAVRNSATLVKPGGVLMVAIYQRHWTSPLWKIIKWAYSSGGALVKKTLLALLYPPLFVATWIATGNHPGQSRRGMEFNHDVVDWVGGYPYEYASEEEIINFVRSLGFTHLHTLPAKVPTGNNEMLFRKN